MNNVYHEEKRMCLNRIFGFEQFIFKALMSLIHRYDYMIDFVVN